MFKAEILADSISDKDIRLTTFLVTYPRMIHSEFLTHGMLVRNSESSRARPVAKNIQDVRDNPFVPEVFGQNQPGMQWSRSVEDDHFARWMWEQGAKTACTWAEGLGQMDVHKSLANRVIEPYKWHTAMYSGTDWNNFFALRTHRDAQPEFRKVALMMREAYEGNSPDHLKPGEWHLPFVTHDEIMDEALSYSDPHTDWELWKSVSAGRSARLSYLTHEGNYDVDADVALARERLIPNGHMSPFGHQARPFSRNEWDMIKDLTDLAYRLYSVGGSLTPFASRMVRNLEYCAQFKGWWQQRADIPNEDDFSKVIGATS